MITSILDSRYRVEQEIGSGGMGRVYRAYDTRLNIPVAIKFTVPKNADEATAFYREAELLSNLNHPSLPRVIDFNRINQTQYIVMEYIEGDDLKTQLENRETPFNQNEVMDWAKQLLNVIGYLHSQGIQHRDIKPANIKIRNNTIYLLDFGIAYGQIGEMSTVSSRSFIWRSGTHEYCSLEQINGAKTTPASDLYSLAATLYVLLSKELPENAESRIQSLALRKTDSLKHISQLVSNLDKKAANILMSALELDAARRPQSAEHMYRMMFSQPVEKRERKFVRKVAAAAGLLTLLLFGIVLGINSSKILGLMTTNDFLRDEDKIVPPTPREEAIELTGDSLRFLQSGNYEQALKKCEEALAKDSEYAFAYFVCGDVRWDTNYDNSESFSEMEKVQQHADKILVLVNNPQSAEDFAARAWANLAKEKYDAAITDATEALKINPQMVAALMIRGSAKSFNPDENNRSFLAAFNDYDEAVRLMPDYVQAKANRAGAYYSLGKYEWAISDYTEAINVLPLARYYEGKASCYFALGKYKEAKEEYTKALKQNSKHLASLIGIAEVYAKEKDWRNAIKNYTKSITIKPNFLAYQNRGYGYGMSGNIDKAIKDFNEALKLDDSNYLTYYYRAFAYINKKNYKSALSDLSEAIDKVPDNEREILAKLYEYRASTYRMLNQKEEEKNDEKMAQRLTN
jgi:serine/threonine protein kinase/lipoprotein NlpI